MIDVFDKIKANSSKTAKHAFIKTMHPLCLVLMDMALDPMAIFNFQIHELPTYQGFHKTGVSDTDAIQSFISFVSYTNTDEFKKMGDFARRSYIENVFKNFTKEQSDLFARVVKKSLGIGVEIKTYTTVFPSRIKPFNVMLCNDYNPNKSYLGWVAEIKYDGLRAVARITGGDVAFISRTGKPLFVSEKIRDTLICAHRSLYSNPSTVVWLDGEIMGDKDLNDVLMKTKTENSPDNSTLRFHAFDMIIGDKWTNQDYHLKLRDRHFNLSVLLRNQSSENRGCVTVATQMHITSDDQLYRAFERVRMSVDPYSKCEGLVLKDPNSAYVWDRSAAWQKMRFKTTEDGKIRDIEYYNSNIVMSVDLPSGLKKVSYGFTDKQKHEFIKYKDSLIGKHAEIQYDATSKAECAFFVRLRPDKD